MINQLHSPDESVAKACPFVGRPDGANPQTS